MAIGYSKIFSKFERSFFEDWLHHSERHFEIFVPNTSFINLINKQGEITPIDIDTIIKKLQSDKNVTLKIKNSFGHAINFSIEVLDDYLAVEEYCMDELIEDKEYDDLFSCLNLRYIVLSNRGLSIGFLFDKEGYSEDYIQIIR